MSFVRELFDFAKNRRAWRNRAEAYSQEGEDMVLSRLFESRAPRSRFYVDVGAHHPTRFSNTYLFYRRGWRGINIEPDPDAVERFRTVRPMDITLNIGIAESAATCRYYRFNEPALNTFDRARALQVSAQGSPYRIQEEMDIRTSPLRDVLATHVPVATLIDFMSIDVEGLDLEVLRSNDWQRFRPRILLVEDLATKLSDVSASPIYSYLTARGYELLAKTVYTFFYVDRAALT